MADTATTTKGTAATSGGTATASGGMVDKNKSAEQYVKDAEDAYIIPALVREKFPDLVKLIYETESMNEEEREYWMQILPIMTEDQIVKFRGILVNERDQLTKLDQEYEQEMTRINKPVAELDEVKMKEKIQEIKQAESVSEEQEAKQEEELLKKLQGL